MGSMNRYDLLEKLGSGGFATVFRTRRKADQRIFALKKVACQNLEDANSALGEAKMLLELDHKHIVNYHDFFLHEELEHGKRKLFVCHVMDFCSGGDLFARLESHHKRGTPIPEEDLRDWGQQLLRALEYLETKRIVHRDIKLANVFFEGSALRLGDFGISKQLTASFARTVMGGTPLYMAPELLTKERYDTKADVWAFGCLVYELATCSLLSMKKGGGLLGALALQDPAKVQETIQEAGRRGYRGLEQTLRQCLVADSRSRASPSALLQRGFFCVEAPAKSDGTSGPPLLTRATEGPRPQGLRPNGALDAPRPQGVRPNGELDGLSVEELCVRADEFDRKKLYDKAEACFKQALKVNPHHARTLCNYGYWLHVVRKDLDSAEHYLRASLSVDPKRTPTLCNYAYLLKARKREREAREVFRRAAELDPQHPWVVKNRAHFA
mmetsp:Transcript_59029/g.138935  ORF Transcript_59029/g.138935 Transcript_59029/m.138935 type:complete len:441 (-) Transcript_59029:453-1775(-)